MLCSDYVIKFYMSFSAWSNWLNWENCTASCNGGTRTRTRRCSGEINACEGENTEIEVNSNLKMYVIRSKLTVDHNA